MGALDVRGRPIGRGGRAFLGGLAVLVIGLGGTVASRSFRRSRVVKRVKSRPG